MPSTFRIPKARITGLYGRMLTAYARPTRGQGFSDLCEIPIPNLASLHDVASNA